MLEDDTVEEELPLPEEEAEFNAATEILSEYPGTPEWNFLDTLLSDINLKGRRLEEVDKAALGAAFEKAANPEIKPGYYSQNETLNFTFKF